MSKRLIPALLALLLVLAACNGDDNDTEPTDDPGPDDTAVDEPGEGETLTVTAVDYNFEGVPATIAAGTQVTIDNQGTEPHELVAFFIPADEERSVQELLALPDEEEPPVEFRGVAIQLTDGSPPFTPEGPIVLEEPGRYAFVCFFPVGLTDADLQEAMEQMDEDSEGPPPLPDGPPHFTEGMWVETVVE